jgi:uncharacterized membrane protein
MSEEAIAGLEAASAAPTPLVRQLEFVDIGRCLGEGARVFARAPLFGMAIGGFYAAGGWLLVALAFRLGLPYLAYPLAAGFALIAPFACAGTYEVSREAELGRRPTWSDVLGAIAGCFGKEIRWLSLVCLFTLILWVDFAWTIFLAFYGLHVPTLSRLAVAVVSTPSGFLFLVVGNAFGALIALFVFSITVVSPTLLFDREIDFVTAMLTSVRLVRANPLVMLAWAAIIGALLFVSIATGLLGLIVVLPVLGHASWALYRRAVV